MRQSTFDRRRTYRRIRAEQRQARLSQRLGHPIERATEPFRCASCGLRVDRSEEIAQLRSAEPAHLHCAIDALRGH